MEPVVFGEILENQDYYEREGVYGILVNTQNQVGIIKTPRGYFLPGGGIEADETHHLCLVREFEEETGRLIQVNEYIGQSIFYDLSPNSNRYLKLIGNYYYVTDVGVSDFKQECDHELVWMTRDEAIRSLKLPHQAWAIRQY